MSKMANKKLRGKENANLKNSNHQCDEDWENDQSFNDRASTLISHETIDQMKIRKNYQMS